MAPGLYLQQIARRASGATLNLQPLRPLSALWRGVESVPEPVFRNWPGEEDTFSLTTPPASPAASPQLPTKAGSDGETFSERVVHPHPELKRAYLPEFAVPVLAESRPLPGQHFLEPQTTTPDLKTAPVVRPGKKELDLNRREPGQPLHIPNPVSFREEASIPVPVVTLQLPRSSLRMTELPIRQLEPSRHPKAAAKAKEEREGEGENPLTEPESPKKPYFLKPSEVARPEVGLNPARREGKGPLFQPPANPVMVHIGTIEVTIVPSPPAQVSAPARLVPPPAPRPTLARNALAREFSSGFGLRQG